MGGHKVGHPVFRLYQDILHSAAAQRIRPKERRLVKIQGL